MSDTAPRNPQAAPRGPLNALIRFCLEQKLVVAILLVGTLFWGVLVAPFDWDLGGLARDRVPVDAIPDIGENQQIVFTEWPGRSPQDIDDQISYPMTVAMLGIPGVKDIRSYSVFGFSSIYIVFEDGIDFYWSRSRVLEKLNSLPSGTLPPGVSPALGPDATALGQVFWYTLEGRDAEGKPTGGWDPHELRSIQDFIVKYKLAGVQGVSEVASIGGFVQEYQVDVNPDAMRAAGVSLGQVIGAVRQSNIDVGARTIEVNRAEYIVRGLGFIESVEDLEQAAITARDGQPILISDIAKVSLGPALRRGVLTKAGEEAVGGVVVARYGENPMATIQRVKDKIAEIAPGLPSKVLADGTESRVSIVPFYDRSGLIRETLQTLNSAIAQQVLVTIIVVVVMVMHLRSSLLIGAMLPITVLMTFIGMKLFRVDANIVALSGIAIAIGTIVDMGIVLSENILRRLDEAAADDATREPPIETIYRATTEVGSAVLTAVATTVVSFLPVFTMEAAEGNGRIGRMLITLLVEHWGLLDQPLLYLSVAFKRRQQEYYARLAAVRTDGDWEGWTAFFLECVRDAAADGVRIAQAIHTLMGRDRARVVRHERATITVVQLLDLLPSNPVLTVPRASELLGITAPPARKAIDLLEELGVLRETTGKQRDRVYAYHAYLELLTES